MNIFMWSGPRNLSTALLRSFENRNDTNVWDEPFYAYYLNETKKNHPMAKEIINKFETDVKKIIELVTQKNINKKIFFQKHMTHHILEYTPTDWVKNGHNCFLIRNPKEVISSFLEKWPEASFEDFGFTDQFNLFNFIKNEIGESPAVIDASDLRNYPEKYLKILCKKIKIPWDPRMLQWEPGLRAYDGVWASHWYPSVQSSTGFNKNSSKRIFTNEVLNIAAQAEELYSELSRYKI